MEIREDQVYINGLSLNYAVCGKGTPMILLHNGGGFWQSWKHQIQYFSDNYQVFALDWPSFGESDTPEGLLTMELLYKTLQSFILQKQLKQIVLIGNCIGASAAFLYTSRHPESVSKLVLFNICPGDLIFSKYIIRTLIPELNKYPRSKKVARALLRFALLKTPIKKRFPRILFGNHYNENDSLFQFYVQKFKINKQTEARINLLFSVHTYTFQDYLGQTPCIPHLLIWGNENRVTTYKKIGMIHKKWLQPEEFELIPDAGHLCMYEAPNVVNKIIETYLLSRHLYGQG